MFLDLLVPTRVSEVPSYACEQGSFVEYQRYPVRFMLKITQYLHKSDLTQEEEEIESSKSFGFEEVKSRKLQEKAMFGVRILGRCSATSLRNFSTTTTQNFSKSSRQFPSRNCNRLFQTEAKTWRTWEGTTKAPGITGKRVKKCIKWYS